MSKLPTIEFYDISCTITSEPWSPFTARTYLTLRLLNIPFKWHLISMAQIEPTLSAAGLARPEHGKYTLPAITLTSSNGEKEWVTESEDIAQRLQSLFSSSGGDLAHSLFPDARCNEQLEDVRTAFKESLYSDGHRWKNIVPPIHRILEPESQEYFIRTRTEDWGKSPADMLSSDGKENEERDGGADKVYAKALQPYADVYEKYKGEKGVWLGGENANYADVKVLAAMQWYKCANTEAFEKGLKEVGGALDRAWNAAQVLFKEK